MSDKVAIVSIIVLGFTTTALAVVVAVMCLGVFGVRMWP